MAPPAIRIRVGASVDSSVNRVFATIEARAQRAHAVIGQQFRQLGPEMASGIEKAGVAWDRVTSRWTSNANRISRETRRMRSESIDAFAQIGKVAEREMNRAARAQARAGQDFARRTSHRATRFLTPNAPLGSVAARAAGDIARGAGIDFSIGNSIGRNVELETAATELSNSGFIRQGQGIQTQRVDPNELKNEAKSVADEFALAPGAALEGQGKFVGKTGDLATSRALLEDMARLSRATGTNLNDMLDAAGDVSSKLGDPAKSLKEAEERARAVTSVMEVIAGQGKLGAVEIKDLAVQMARVAGNAGSFEGDRSENIIKLGALAQLARQGTATSAADSARSVSAFATTLKKNARVKAFEAEGVNVFSDESRTKNRDPFEIIKDSLMATGGDMPRLNKMFMDTLGAKAVENLSNTFKDAGGGEAGLAAIDKMVDGFTKKAVVNRAEQDESVARVMNTTAAKVQRFQNRLDDVGDQLRANLLPAFDELAPSLLKLAEVTSNVATWTAENPKKAIGIAISAAIARAGMESALRSGIERLILGPNGGLGTSSQASKIGNAAATLGGAVTIAALAVTTLTVGMAIIDSLVNEDKEKQRQAITNDLEGFQLEQRIRDGSFTPDEAQKKAQELVQQRTKQKDEALANGSGWDKAFRDVVVGGIAGFFSKDIKEAIQGQKDIERKQVENAAREQTEARILLANLNQMIADGITVKNMPEGAIPGRVEQ